MSHSNAPEPWMERAAAFLGCDVNELSGLAGVLTDGSCWFAADDIPERMVIPVPLRSTSQTTVYFARWKRGARMRPQFHDTRLSVLVIQGGLHETAGMHHPTGSLFVREPGTEPGGQMDADVDSIFLVRCDFVSRPKAHPLDRGMHPPARAKGD